MEEQNEKLLKTLNAKEEELRTAQVNYIQNFFIDLKKVIISKGSLVRLNYPYVYQIRDTHSHTVFFSTIFKKCLNQGEKGETPVLRSTGGVEAEYKRSTVEYEWSTSGV